MLSYVSQVQAFSLSDGYAEEQSDPAFAVYIG